MKKYLLLSVFMLLFASISCAAEPIKIGLMGPLTGPWASEGQEMKQVVNLLADQLNDKGGLLGRKVEVVVEDDGGDPKTSALAAQRLVTKGIVAVVGTYGSSITEASQNIYNESKIIQIANGSTAVRLTEKGMPYFFRTCPRDDEQGRVSAQAIMKMNVKNVAILHDNTTYAKGLAQEAKAVLKGVKIVFFDALTPGERDYTSILTKLKAAKPDLVFFTGYYPEAGMLLRQKYQMKWNVPFMGGDAQNNPDLVKITGKEAASGFFFVSSPLPKDLPSKPAKAFLTTFAKKYGHPPNSIYSTLAGDGFKAVTAAIAQAKSTDPNKMAAYLHKGYKDANGLTGAISFNAKGDRVGEVYKVYKVNLQGVFVLQK
ncbi:MAG: branched-chain amino acid transport system substrate-binding protein, livK [Syntrophus sp. SKADARSKE-3]|nr:branched-chain amino acid transport system substrate-binding protein, livK [Syntrophus sp. SKADARSKE-3]